MRIDRVSATTLAIPFRTPFIGGSQRWQDRRLTLLSLRTDTGIEGLAEFAAPVTDDLGVDVSPELSRMLEGIDLADPVALERALRNLDAWPFVGRVARAAVESALVDLLARSSRVSVAGWLAPDVARDVAVNALIGMLPAEAAAARAAEYVAEGYRTLKLKGSDEPPGALKGRVAAVRDASGSDIALRVDFNGQLSVRRAASVIAELTPFGIDYVEQPTSPRAGVAALARLRNVCDIRIAADEAVRDHGSARQLIEQDAVDVIVVKPARVGGLRQASSIAELATSAGVSVTVSTLFESGVGIAGALQLAATLPGSQGHGLATADLFESDLLVRPLEITAGQMALPAMPGLGVELDPAAIDRYRLP